MAQDDKTVLVLDNEQAEVLEKATELLFRLHIGQFEEIKWRLRSRISNKSCVNWDTIEGVLLLLRGALFPELSNGESFNVDCCDESAVAYSIYQAIRHANAWRRNPQGGIGVAFDPPHSVGKSIPKCYIAKEGDDICHPNTKQQAER